MGCGASATSASHSTSVAADHPEPEKSAGSTIPAEVPPAEAPPVEKKTSVVKVAPTPRAARAEDILGQGTPEEQLAELLKAKPFIEQENNFLRPYVDWCRDALSRGCMDDAQDELDRIAMELANEEKIVVAAFLRFDNEKDHVLEPQEIDFMMDYLGFPNSPDDVEKFVSMMDRNDDDVISFDEFLQTVGRMGGSAKLFQIRKQQIQARTSFKDSVHSQEELRSQLKACGFSETAQKTWQPVASGSEFDAAANMDPCQKEAIRHIRAIAESNHERALPKLVERVKRLGFAEDDLWMCFAWIRELSPIIIHVNLDSLAMCLKTDTHYRNQFETSTSSGLLKPMVRVKWEKGLFGPAYDDALPFQRPKYGVQNVWNDHRGVMGCKQYGDSYLVLKDIRLRCTLSPQDSGNLASRRLAVLDYYGHVLAEYSDNELTEVLRIAQGGAQKIGDSEAVIGQWGKYKEAQIHGEIRLDTHVDRIVVNERHRAHASLIEEIANKHDWKLTWIDDMKQELQAMAEGHEMKSSEWNAMLSSLSEVQPAPPESAPLLEHDNPAPEEALDVSHGADMWFERTRNQYGVAHLAISGESSQSLR